MNLCGIIVEYNPFHNGHKYHIEQAKKLSNADAVIAIMSGHFTQRGELSVLDKFDKARIALENGVDLVIELPFIYATQNASIFANGAIKILNKCQINSLCFGSETNDIDTLKDIASFEINPDHLKELMKEGNSYPKAISLLSDSFFPNDILAIAYLKALRGTNIKPIGILRTNDYHSKEMAKIASATAIREAILNHEDYSLATNVKISYPVFTKDLYPYLRKILLVTPREELIKIHMVSEGIEKVLMTNALKYDNYDDFIDHSVSRRYTKSRIQRIIIQIMLHINKEDIKDLDVNHIRVLGFNSKGKEVIKYLQSKDVEVITQFKKIDSTYRQIEYKATCLYASIQNEERFKYLTKRELMGPVIIK